VGGFSSAEPTSSDFKLLTGDSRLANDRLESAELDFFMGRYRYRDRRSSHPLLHYNVTASLTYHFKAVPQQDLADLLSGQDSQVTQQLPQAV
jgi:hypothetical protein